MFVIEALEKFFSLVLGFFAAVLIGLFFLIRAVLRILICFVRGLLGLLVPPLRYKLRLSWLLRDAVHGDGARLHTGVFSTEELTGAESDRVFMRMRQCMDTYRAQKQRRRGKNAVYDETDRLYPEFVKQFSIAADTINWSSFSRNPQRHPAYQNMQKAVEGTEALLAKQEEALPPEVMRAAR